MADGIAIVGLPGSGKSSVGRCVAERLGRPFVDLDEEIARATGRSAAEILRGNGEPALREVERAALARACAVAGAVIATGGGTPLDPLNRWALMEHGLRVRLDAPLDVLAARLTSDGVARPLLGHDTQAGLARTSAEREPVYAAVDLAVDADRPVEAVTEAIVGAHAGWPPGGRWRPLYDDRYERHHPVGPADGRLALGVGLSGEALAGLLAHFEGRQPAVVADSRALRLLPGLGSALPTNRRLAIAGGERAKTFDRLRRLLSWLSAQGAERADPLLAVGGGTVGDLAGLAAALHQRGMPLVQLPTTWLAQADSSIGGKVAIDLPGAKNAVGAIWPAWLIVADTGWLAGLPAQRRRDGLAEVLKAGLIGDSALWQLVEERGRAALAGRDEAAVYAMTERAARVKLAIVGRDPYEGGERRQLNLGHTLGHALEVDSGYRLSHGAAVALGLRAVACIAAGRGAEPDLPARIDAVLAELGFATHHHFDRAAVRAALLTDKKRERGRQRWILPIAVGQVAEVADVTDSELDAAMAAIAE